MVTDPSASYDSAMTTLKFTPHVLAAGARARGGFICRYFLGKLIAGHVVCEHCGAIQVIGSPQMGCAYWEREPGAADQ
jgi:hypothetical protein